MSKDAITRAIEAAGGQTKLARGINAPQQQVWNWQAGRPIPEHRCPPIERETRVPCEQLRPDVTWLRVADPEWPWHPEGRPCIDVARPAGAGVAPEGEQRAAA
jgi:DNA-binding transcriptional regulator YdaS (Cro superfamily)